MSVVFRNYDYKTNTESFTEGAYAGQVISIFQKVSRDMDGWEHGTYPVACVWDNGQVKQVVAGDDPKTNFVDLTDENRQEYLQALWNSVFEYNVSNMTNSSHSVAQRPNRGDSAVVVRGRKIPNGTTGKVIGFSKPNSFGVTKVGLATTDRVEKVIFGRKEYDKHLDVVWVDVKNVEKVDWKNELPSEKEIEEEATKMADAYIESLEEKMTNPKWITSEVPVPRHYNR